MDFVVILKTNFTCYNILVFKIVRGLTLKYRKDSIKLDKPQSEIYKHCINILEGNNFSVSNSDEFSGIIEAESEISSKSWGENITVELESLENQKTLVKITSRSKMPTTLVDWGKNDENIYAIKENLLRI